MKNGLSLAVATVLLSLVFWRCAAVRETARPAWRVDRLTPTERLLVDRGAAGAPMDVVTNDAPAGDAFLRAAAIPVDPGDPALAQLVARMQASVIAEKGVGIAAPQVGISRRVVIVQRLDREPDAPFVPYLNPAITDQSDETAVEWEGCLSVPAGHGKVRRPRAITVEYDAADGGRAAERVEGFTARIFLHEIDHLDGILFIDIKEPGPLMPKEEYREMRRRERERKDAAERTIRDTMKDLKEPAQ